MNLDLDDFQLKNLLDEAYSYKGPKDKENKSEIFKELLHKAELEDQQQDSFFSSHEYRGSGRRAHPHSGSLQDLVDSVKNEQLDCDYMGSQARRHPQHPRYAKNSSSVSSRQREGGSLPNNVNSSSSCPISSFSLSKYPKSNTKNCNKYKADTHDFERNLTNHHRNATIGESLSLCEETQPSIPSTSASVSCANEKTHTVINIEPDQEEARHLLAHESLAQNIPKTVHDDGTELMSIQQQRSPTMNVYSTSTVKEQGESSRPNCHVDQQIPFTGYLKPLGDSQPAKQLLKNPVVSNRYVLQNPPLTTLSSKFDENGNAIIPKQPTTVAPSQGKGKVKRSKADRNISKTWTVPERSGAEDNIDQILAFIENTDTTKKTNIINVNKNNLSVAERSKKEKKNASGNKKEDSRLKKSTSMEELKSSSKIEEEKAQSERNAVRQKQLQQQNTQKRNSTSDGKDLAAKHTSNQMQSNKRGERRSWDTEELANFEAIDDRDTKKHKESKSNMKNFKKTEQVASTNASIESIPTNIEAAGFHVVTKKKKTKKRQILEEAKAKQQQLHQRNDQVHMHGRHTNSNAPMAHKYQPSSTYTNDRDIYVNSLMAKENRRKSTSSVPPSDKSDSSDLDSVHSLPVESTTTSTSIISYAEIARKANQPEKLSNVNAWPAVSHNGKISESPENSNTSTSSSTVSSKSHASNRSCDTIKAASPNEERFAPSADEAKMLETPKSQQSASDCVKNQLQKSKSCDSEKYSTAMSMDQFPGLEKTVKPQKSHPNFASVLTSPPPQPQTQPPLASLLSSSVAVNEKSTKGQPTKKPVAATEAHHPKENAAKAQKAAEEKVDSSKSSTAVDVNHSKLVFVQNSAKAEEIANSDSSNLFVSITMKKAKKLQQNSNSMLATVSSKNGNGSQRTVRQNAVIFSDRDTNHENVSPLLFGDFNDDILQLMKQEENHMDDGQSNCTSNYDGVEYYAMNDCGQLKPNNPTPMTSSQSDPGYASAHCTAAPTESHGAVDIHQNHVGISTITELTNKKSNVTKKTSLNKINVNNNNNNHKISDVVSNQTLNDNNTLSIGDISVKSVTVPQQSASDSDSLNNNLSTQQLTNDTSRSDEATRSSQQQHPDGGIHKAPSNVPNHVHSPITSATNQQMAPSSNPSNPGVVAGDNANNTNLDNLTNGPKMMATTSSSSTQQQVSSTVNDVVPVNSHPANISQKSASCAETRVPLVVHNHNHNDIVDFVGSAWEEVKYGRAHYFSGQ